MKRLFFINCKNITHYAFEPLKDGKSAFQILQEELVDYKDIHYITGRSDSAVPDQNRHQGIESEIQLLSLMHDISEKESERTQIVWLSGLSPFYLNERLLQLSEIHESWQASFTFADGYPFGMFPEIINSGDIPKMLKLADSSPVSESFSFFTVLSRNINDFDIESVMVKKDIRQLRVELLCNNKGNTMLCSRFLDKRALKADELVHFILDNQNKLMTLPYYYQIQVNTTCPQSCSYCPYPHFEEEKHGFIKLNDFEIILDKISQFSPESHISLGLWGEPALHPEISPLIQLFEKYPGLTPVIETSGIGWPEDLIQTLSDKLLSKILWIVSIDSVNPETYKTIRGEGLAEAVRFAELINRKSQVYAQSVRMISNNEELTEFLAFWDDRNIPTIIQKYDTFAGVLPDLKIIDLQPVNRHACWHLKRELAIDYKGDVRMCREVLNDGDSVLGNILKSSPEEMWESQKLIFNRQLSGHYTDVCRRCDEYYTFNF